MRRSRPHLDGLWRHPDFVRLWSAETISTYGTMVSALALPFIAITALDATPRQVAMLGVAEMAPAFLLGPLAGALADRRARRPIMIVTDVLRALVLLGIPIMAWGGALHMGMLYVVAGIVGVLSVTFDVANRALLPVLVRRSQLVEANSKLTGGGSVAEFVAFASVGWLVQLLTGPVTMLIDAATYLVSAMLVSRIRTPQPPVVRANGRPHVVRESVDGFGVVLRDPVLRALGGATLILYLALQVVGTVYLLYVLRGLGFSEGISGVAFAVGGGASLLAAVFAGPLTRAFGVGPALIASVVVATLGNLLVPLASGAGVVAFVLIVLQQFIGDSALVVFMIADRSVVQARVPDTQQGRVQAAYRSLQFGAMVLGAVAGGWLGSAVGIRPTLMGGCLALSLAAVPLVLSPVRTLRDIPTVDDDDAGDDGPPGPDEVSPVVGVSTTSVSAAT